MAQILLAIMTLITTICCFLAFGLYSVKSFVWKYRKQEATFFGAGLFYGSPAQITEKYENTIYPAPWAISIIWPVVLIWNISAMTFMFFQRNAALYLPVKTYALWTGAWFLTTAWTFLFDSESHLGALLSVLFVMIFSAISLRKACKVFLNYQEQVRKLDISKTVMNHPFRFLVLESLAILTMWSVCAFAISIAYALAYKNSLHSTEAIRSGFLVPDESATLGAIFILITFVAWWILDVAYWVEYTECIRTMYPAFCLVMMSLGLSNYTPEKGLTLNNILCFGSSVLSLVAMLTRRSVKQIIQRKIDSRRPAVHNGLHKIE